MPVPNDPPPTPPAVALPVSPAMTPLPKGAVPSAYDAALMAQHAEAERIAALPPPPVDPYAARITHAPSDLDFGEGSLDSGPSSGRTTTVVRVLDTTGEVGPGKNMGPRVVDPDLPERVQEAVARQTGVRVLSHILPREGVEQEEPLLARILRLPKVRPMSEQRHAAAMQPLGRAPEAVRDRARQRFDRCLDDAYAIARGTPVEMVRIDEVTGQPRAMFVSPSVTERLKAMELLAKHGAMQQFAKGRTEDPLTALAQLLGMPRELMEALVNGTATQVLIEEAGL